MISVKPFCIITSMRQYFPIPRLTEAEIQRFRGFINTAPSQGPKGTCHEWTGDTTDGYGRIRFHNRSYRAHRIAKFLATGTDPGSLMVCHHCDNPSCCRAEHLFVGTNGDNMRDARAKGRGPASWYVERSAAERQESNRKNRRKWTQFYIQNRRCTSCGTPLSISELRRRCIKCAGPPRPLRNVTPRSPGRASTVPAPSSFWGPIHEFIIVERKVFHRSLQELGTLMGVSRERIRQLQY